jgi:hypothetical protein
MVGQACNPLCIAGVGVSEPAHSPDKSVSIGQFETRGLNPASTATTSKNGVISSSRGALFHLVLRTLSKDLHPGLCTATCRYERLAPQPNLRESSFSCSVAP